MADVLGSHLVLGVEAGLERKQAQDQVYRAGNVLHPPRPPGPHGRADHVHRRQSAPAQAAFQGKIEVRRIDADDAIRPVGAEMPVQFAAHAQDVRQLGQHFGQPHHRQAVDGLNAVAAGFTHARTGDAVESRIGKTAAQGMHQRPTEQVARCFSCDQGEFHGPRPYFWIKRFEFSTNSSMRRTCGERWAISASSAFISSWRRPARNMVR